MAPLPYFELHAHSHFSLLDGASSPDALVQRAAELEVPALALTDHNALYGAVPFARAAEASEIQPIFGAELTLEGGHHLTLLVADETGWANLCWLITAAQAHAPKGEAALAVKCLEGHTEGLIALWLRAGAYHAGPVAQGQPGGACGGARAGATLWSRARLDRAATPPQAR